MPVPKGQRYGGRQKGVSNKIGREVRELAQKFGPASIKGLIDIAQDENEPTAARVSAYKEVLDRGYGESAQPVTGEGGEGPVEMSVTKIERVIIDPKNPDAESVSTLAAAEAVPGRARRARSS